METKGELLKRFGGWIEKVRRIAAMQGSVWALPATEGWSVKDVVAHMAAWDRHFYETAVEPASLGRPITYRHLEYDAFNAEAVEQGRMRSAAEMAEEAIQARAAILETLERIPEAMYDASFPDGDGNPFSVRQYILDFLWHDEHHEAQIRRALEETAPALEW